MRVSASLRSLAGLAALLAVACAPGAEPVERVVLISVDTLRADHVGAYGNPWIHTPTLDGLAARGVRFSTAIAPTPLTLPSHSSLLTGLEPPRHGVRNNSTFRLPDEIPTLAERMQEAGFATAAFVGAVVLDRQYGLARGFDVYGDRMSVRRAAGEKSFTERRADHVVDEALAWLREAPPRFFLWVHFYDPHANYDPPPGFQAVHPRNPYAGEIAFVDAQLQRLLADLEQRWPDGRTLVVATSDHGESLGEHGEFTHSLTLYDATQRVPLLLAGPGLPRETVADGVVGLVDVAPTILALAGARPLEDADGQDLREALGTQPAPRVAYLETLSPQTDFGWSPLLGLRSDRFKYIRAPRPELYVLETDPHELDNRVESESERVRELDAQLSARLVRQRPPATLAPDARTRARLEALGYLVARDPIDTATLGVVGGADPKDRIPQLRPLFAAMALLGQNEPRAALESLRTLDDEGLVVSLLRSEAALAAAEFEEAVSAARSAVALSPSSASAQSTLAEALEGAGRLEEAAEAHRAAAELDPAFADPLVGLGRIAEARGQAPEALDYYLRAAERRGGSAEALWRSAALRIEAGAPPDPVLAALPEEALDEARAVARLASAEARAGHPARARARLREALARWPGDANLEQALGDLAPGPSGSGELPGFTGPTPRAAGGGPRSPEGPSPPPRR